MGPSFGQPWRLWGWKLPVVGDLQQLSHGDSKRPPRKFPDVPRRDAQPGEWNTGLRTWEGVLYQRLAGAPSQPKISLGLEHVCLKWEPTQMKHEILQLS